MLSSDPRGALAATPDPSLERPEAQTGQSTLQRAPLEMGQEQRGLPGAGHCPSSACGWERSQERNAFLVWRQAKDRRENVVLNQDMSLLPARCQPAAPGPHFSDLHERGSRQQPGKLTSSLAVTFHGLGRRTGGPDPFKEPSLQAGTDRQTQGDTECHLQSTEPALPWILLEAGEPLISGQRLNTPFK